MAKIAFMVHSLDIGGIQRVTTTIANGLAADGYDVTLVNMSNAKDCFPIRVQHYVRPALLRFSFDRVHRKINRLFKRNIESSVVEHRIRAIFSEGDFDYIVLNPEFFEYFDLIKDLHPESKIYLWMHNNYDTYVDKYFGNNKEALFHAAKEADGIICLESYTAQCWQQWNDAVRVIHNPLTMPDCGHHSDLQSKVIACASRLAREHKGLDFLLDIADGLPDGWCIKLAGDGGDRAWLESSIERRNLSDKLVLLGALDDEALDRHYADASIFLSTSRWEGFSLVTVEAMSRGLPIVAFDNPALEEVTHGGRDGVLVPCGDIREMSRVLSKLTADYDLRKKYSDLSLERVKAFSLDHILRQWEMELLLSDDNH